MRQRQLLKIAFTGLLVVEAATGFPQLFRNKSQPPTEPIAAVPTTHEKASAAYNYYYDCARSSLSTSLNNIQEFLSPPIAQTETWTTWFRREWPLMDWKVGVFLWRSCGGVMIILTILSILPGRLHGYAAGVLRWPVLGIVNFLIVVELLVYIVIRLFIRIAEYVVARPKHRALRRRMMHATSYDEWRTYARELDISQKRHLWLEQKGVGAHYNWTLIQELLTSMRTARETGDSLMALATLQQCTRKNVGGIMSEDLFSYANTGEPKHVVTEFVEEVVTCARWLTNEVVRAQTSTPAEDETEGQAEKQKKQYNEMLQETVSSEKEKLWQSVLSATLSILGTTESPSPSPHHEPPDQALAVFHRQQVLAFMKRARAAYGRTALCLSGGAMMSLYHFGHVRAMIEAGVLPHIISGTSGGSMVAAVVGTRTDEELKRDLNPRILIQHLSCFDRPWGERMKSLWETGAMFSFDTWLERLKWFTCGDMTFAEAYRKTGKVFCVTLSSTTKKSPPVLLSHVTTPNVTIASAVVASAAVPGFIPAVRLQYKDQNGVVKAQDGETFYDGSIERDIPVNGLAEMFNCQYIIACQCNPHIVPFFYNCKGGVGRPTRWQCGTQEDSWRGGFMLAALEMYLKNDMKAKFRFLHELGAGIGWSSSLLVQDFEGSTTIVPQVKFKDYFRLFSDPTLDEVYQYFQTGSVAAYEHLALIKLHYKLADIMDECIERLEDCSKTNPRHSSSMKRLRSSVMKRSSLVIPIHDEPRVLTCGLTEGSPRQRHGSSSTESLHDMMNEEDDEDEYERQWVQMDSY